ncbi:cytochrome c oxidase subunit II [Segatella bryantii]|nr:hypothetical protein [Segatella bryantii]UKK75224.1 hypothetical protein L6471_01790 [Segatella bryantii]UKK81901.1 hypothetical protein L6474_12305 [Segatella bryantii]
MKNKILQISAIIAIFIVAIVRIVDNTEKIILHWDLWGNITSYCSKYYIIFLPIISLIIYALFRYYKRNPYKMNQISKIEVTPDNTKLLSRYISIVASLILLVLLYITVCSAQITKLQPTIVIAILFFIIGYYIYTNIKLRRK